MTISDEDGSLVIVSSPLMVGWVYVGLYAVFILVSGLIAVAFRKPWRRVIIAASIVLRTPATILRVVPPLKDLSKNRLFFEGLSEFG